MIAPPLPAPQQQDSAVTPPAVNDTPPAESTSSPPDQTALPPDAELIPDEIALNVDAKTFKQQQTQQELSVIKQQLQSAHPTTETNNTGNGDLWQRIRLGLKMDLPTDRPEILYYIVQLSHRPNLLDQYLRNAHRYLHYIVEQVEKENMPMEVALLPIVESALNPRAYSRAAAAGMWQFIYSTAQQQKMDYDWWYDKRGSVVGSTKHGIGFLQQLHGQFDDWWLAFAAYNAGPGRVRGAVNAYQSTNYWDIPLLEETRGYVPKIIALAHVIKYPELFNVSLPAVPDEPYFRQITLPKNTQIDLEQLAQIIGMDKDELLQMNAEYRRRITRPGDVEQTILVPIKYYDIAVDKFIQAKFNNKLGASPKSIAYRVQRGETLAQIARRYGTTSEILRKLNNMSSTKVRRRQRIVIPYNSDAMLYTVRRGDSLWTIAKRYGMTVSQVARYNNISSRSSIHPGQQLRLGGAQKTGAGAPRISHVVRKGQSLGLLARRYGVSIANIKIWNNLRSNTIRIGQKLAIHPPTQASHYRVRRGDTLGKIARRFGVSVSALKRLNRLKGDIIVVGKTLRLRP